MNYIWVIGLFLIIVLYGQWIDFLTKSEKKKTKEAQDEIMPIVSEKEKGYNLKGNSILNLRMMSLFMAVEGEKEKEVLRKKFIDIVDGYKLQPARFFALQISRAFLYVAMIYVALFYFYEEPNLYMAYLTVFVVAMLGLLKKNYVFVVVMAIIGLIIYPKLPATILLLLMMNRIWTYAKKRNKK